MQLQMTLAVVGAIRGTVGDLDEIKIIDFYVVNHNINRGCY